MRYTPKVQSADKIVQNLSGGRIFAARFRQLENPQNGFLFYGRFGPPPHLSA